MRLLWICVPEDSGKMRIVGQQRKVVPVPKEKNKVRQSNDFQDLLVQHNSRFDLFPNLDEYNPRIQIYEYTFRIDQRSVLFETRKIVSNIEQGPEFDLSISDPHNQT
jgi:hypothetical protein